MSSLASRIIIEFVLFPLQFYCFIWLHGESGEGGYQLLEHHSHDLVMVRTEIVQKKRKDSPHALLSGGSHSGSKTSPMAAVPALEILFSISFRGLRLEEVLPFIGLKKTLFSAFS